MMTANQASYVNDAAATAGPQTITVTNGIAAGKLTSSAASVNYGTSVTQTTTFTASDSAEPSGTVTFQSGTTSGLAHDERPMIAPLARMISSFPMPGTVQKTASQMIDGILE
jgi:hypothetical protein